LKASSKRPISVIEIKTNPETSAPADRPWPLTGQKRLRRHEWKVINEYPPTVPREYRLNNKNF
jgi:hypothetical protein